YRIMADSTPVVEWEPAVVTGMRVARLFRGQAGGAVATPRARAEAFLRDELAAGAVPTTELFETGLAAGFSVSTLKRAKENRGILSQYAGRPGESGVWSWRMPEVTGEAQDPEN